MKTILTAVLALALPVALAAQPPATPAATANPITAAFKGRILGQHRNIAQAFDSIPESKFSYKPTPAQLTIGYVAQHLVSDSYFFCNNFGAVKADVPAADAATPDSVRALWPREQLLTKLKAAFTFCASALDQIDDAKLADAITITFNGNSRQSTKASMVLGHALDLTDHYSQLANYMRLNNILPPTALPRPPRP